MNVLFKLINHFLVNVASEVLELIYVDTPGCLEISAWQISFFFFTKRDRWFSDALLRNSHRLMSRLMTFFIDFGDNSNIKSINSKFSSMFRGRTHYIKQLFSTIIRINFGVATQNMVCSPLELKLNMSRKHVKKIVLD